MGLTLSISPSQLLQRLPVRPRLHAGPEPPDAPSCSSFCGDSHHEVLLPWICRATRVPGPCHPPLWFHWPTTALSPGSGQGDGGSLTHLSSSISVLGPGDFLRSPVGIFCPCPLQQHQPLGKTSSGPQVSSPAHSIRLSGQQLLFAVLKSLQNPSERSNIGKHCSSRRTNAPFSAFSAPFQHSSLTTGSL